MNFLRYLLEAILNRISRCEIIGFHHTSRISNAESRYTKFQKKLIYKQYLVQRVEMKSKSKKTEKRSHYYNMLVKIRSTVSSIL